MKLPCKFNCISLAFEGLSPLPKARDATYNHFQVLGLLLAKEYPSHWSLQKQWTGSSLDLSNQETTEKVLPRTK